MSGIRPCPSCVGNNHSPNSVETKIKFYFFVLNFKSAFYFQIATKLLKQNWKLLNNVGKTFVLCVRKQQQHQFYFKSVIFKSGHKKSPNSFFFRQILKLGTFQRKFVAEMFEKQPNLVTLLCQSISQQLKGVDRVTSLYVLLQLKFLGLVAFKHGLLPQWNTLLANFT